MLIYKFSLTNCIFISCFLINYLKILIIIHKNIFISINCVAYKLKCKLIQTKRQSKTISLNLKTLCLLYFTKQKIKRPFIQTKIFNLKISHLKYKIQFWCYIHFQKSLCATPCNVKFNWEITWKIIFSKNHPQKFGAIKNLGFRSNITLDVYIKNKNKVKKTVNFVLFINILPKKYTIQKYTFWNVHYF
jgi:hypothetical protein